MNEDILIRFLTHRCTTEEIKEIDQWIAASQANADWLFEMERTWSLKDQLRFSDKQKIEMAYARFMSGLQEKETKVQIVQRRSAYIVWLKYAAAIVLIGLLSTNLFYQLREEPVAMNMVETHRKSKSLLFDLI